MTEQERMSYRGYLFSMTDEQLHEETRTVVSQSKTDEVTKRDSAMLMAMCYNDWRRRGKGEEYFKAYQAIENK